MSDTGSNRLRSSVGTWLFRIGATLAVSFVLLGVELGWLAHSYQERTWSAVAVIDATDAPSIMTTTSMKDKMEGIVVMRAPGSWYANRQILNATGSTPRVKLSDDEAPIVRQTKSWAHWITKVDQTQGACTAEGAVGYPLPALQWSHGSKREQGGWKWIRNYWNAHVIPGTRERAYVLDGAVWTNPGSPHRIYPTAVAWRGMIVDWLVALACAIVVMAGWRWGAHYLKLLRGRWRQSRGRCAACGYHIGAIPICPECGTKVVTRNALDSRNRFAVRIDGLVDGA